MEEEGEGGDGGWEEGEEQDGKGEGDGEGESEASPMFVPKKGVFFQHDDRYTPAENKEQEEGSVY